MQYSVVSGLSSVVSPLRTKVRRPQTRIAIPHIAERSRRVVGRRQPTLDLLAQRRQPRLARPAGDERRRRAAGRRAGVVGL